MEASVVRIKKNGQRWFMDESIQRQTQIARAKGIPAPTPRQLLHAHMVQALGHVEWFAPHLPHGDSSIEIAAARQALLELIVFLEQNQ